MKKSSLLTVIVLVSIILFHIILNLIWLKIEIAPPMWDQAGYTTYTLMFSEALRELNIGNFFRTFLHYQRGRAPLAFIVTAPFFLLFGFSIDVATASNFIYIIIFILATYGIGKKLYGRGAGLLSAFVVSTIPVLSGLSRQFLPDYGLAAFAALSIYALLKTEYFSKRLASVCLGLACGLGMMMKITFPLFFAAPFIYVAIFSLITKRKREERRTLLINLAIFATVTLLITGLWYIHNFKYWFTYLYRASFGDRIKRYWPDNYFNLKDLWKYTRVFIVGEVSPFYSLLGFVLFLFIFAHRTIRDVSQNAKFNLFSFLKSQSFVLFLWFTVPYIVVASSRNRDPRQNIACIAPLGLILASLVLAIPTRWLKRTLIFFIVLLGSVQLIKASFGLDYPEIPPVEIHSRNFYFFPHYYTSCVAPDTNTWQIKEILLYIHQMESSAKKKNPYKCIVIGFIPDIPRFQSIALKYYMTLLKLPYETIKVAGYYFEKGNYSTDYCKYIITKTGDICTPYAPWPVKYNKEAMQIIQHSGNFIKLDKEFPLPDGSSAVIYKRIRGEVICP